MAQGVPGRLRPRIFLTFRHYKGGRSSAIRTGRIYPRRNPWYSLSEAESTSGHMVLSGKGTEKIPSDTTGNRSQDLPNSSEVPTLPQAISSLYERKFIWKKAFRFPPATVISAALLAALTGITSVKIPSDIGIYDFC